MKRAWGRGGALAVVSLLLIGTAAAALAGNRPIADHLREHGFNDLQIESTLANGWSIGGLTQMYGFADDPLGTPGVSEADSAGVVPTAIGVDLVRFTDPDLLPPPVFGVTVMDDKLLIPFGDGPVQLNTDYLWFWAEMEGKIEYNLPGVGLNIAWPSYVEGSDRWESSFAGDSWVGGSHIPVVYNSPSDPLEWVAELYRVDGASLNPYSGPGGLAWIEGSTLGFYAPAAAFDDVGVSSGGVSGAVALPFDTNQFKLAEYGFASDITLNATSQFDPNAPRKVTVYPANFAADGRQGGLEPFEIGDRFRINAGFSTYADIRSARLIRDGDGGLWASLTPLGMWPIDAPASHFLEEYFSMAVGVTISYGDMSGPAVIQEFHDGESSSLGFFGSDEFVPLAIHLMSDGTLNIDLNYSYDDLLAEAEVVTLSTFSAFWLDEADPNGRQQTDLVTGIPVSSIPEEDPSGDGEDRVPVYDFVTDEQLVTEADLVPDEPTPTATPAETTSTTAPPVATEDVGIPVSDDVVVGGGECTWCWAGVALFVGFLLAVLFLWLKQYDWWTCWIPWFIVIFAWVPFLLAGLWWWRPAWWWAPLLAWFPVIGGYTWYWAQKRSWWQPWHLYVVGGYLATLAAAMVIVGAPEWGLLLPLFWAPWVAFYLWFRGSRQPWWQPWMWAVALGYVAWVFIWVTRLTPWWAWWLPVALLVVTAWWCVAHSLRWRALIGPLWCWVVPFALMPFFAWWIPLWGPWWCLAILGFFGLTFLGAVFNHFKPRSWWSCWIPWFLIVWVGIPFLLVGLWFFQPNWWWLPLLAWFPLVVGYSYYWAQRRSWWQGWYWYAVIGYLAAAAAAMYVVGSPTWGLLLPVFWLVPAAFYLWYRPRRQPWFRPWMWAGFAGWIGFVFLWVINLTPYWGGWFPLLALPLFGWWGMSNGYDRLTWGEKATAVLPLLLVPWLGYMVAIYCIPEYYLGL